MRTSAGPFTEQQRLEVPTLPVRRFTVLECHRLIGDGFFNSDDRYELMEGWIVARTTRSPRHEVSKSLVWDVLRERIPRGWHVRTSVGFTTEDSETEPDAAAVRGEILDYVHRHPGPGDAALVVEVADQTLPIDRGIKCRLYARGGALTYWIVNLVDSCVEVYSCRPDNGIERQYRRQDYRVGQELPLVIDGIDRGPVFVRDLIPSAQH